MKFHGYNLLSARWTCNGATHKHSQQDLRFAMHAAHGEFARIILASGDIEECFFDAAEVFNLAEKYQMPVIHLLDKGMANSSQTYPIFNYGKVKIDRGLIVGEKSLKAKCTNDSNSPKQASP